MTGDSPPIQHFGASHIGVLAGTASVAVVWIWLARRGHPWAKWLEWFFAGVVLLVWPVGVSLGIAIDSIQAHNFNEHFLPLQLCDVVAICCGLALLTRRREFAEFAYFFGVSGTLNGLITPDLQYDFPHPEFIRFFALHSGIVIVVAYLIFGRRQWPERGAWLRGVLWGEAYVGAALLVSWISGGNFGFMLEPPAQASLFDMLGGYPAYIFWEQPLGMFLLLVLYAPFWWLNRRRSAAAS